MLLGADNWPVEVAPNPDPTALAAGPPACARRERRASAGEHEARRTGAKKVYEFAFMMQPLKIQGGTGSTVSPIAVR